MAAGAGDDLTGKGKQSRGEKKARKIMSKLGLKQVSSLSTSVPDPILLGQLYTDTHGTKNVF